MIFNFLRSSAVRIEVDEVVVSFFIVLNLISKLFLLAAFNICNRTTESLDVPLTFVDGSISLFLFEFSADNNGSFVFVHATLYLLLVWPGVLHLPNGPSLTRSKDIHGVSS